MQSKRETGVLLKSPENARWAATATVADVIYRRREDVAFAQSCIVQETQGVDWK